MFGMKIKEEPVVQKASNVRQQILSHVEVSPPRRDLPALWRPCGMCDQTGIEKLHGYPMRCPTCGGKGIILTEDGKAILELLEVAETHPPVTDEQVQEAIEKDKAERQERERQLEEQRKAGEKQEKKRQKALEDLVKAGFDPDELRW